MVKRFLMYLFVLLALLFLSNIVFAQEAVKNKLSLNNDREKDVCNAVKKAIQEGFNTKDIVKTGIELGHNVWLIVKCAISWGGELKDVVTVAIEAGATSDVVSRCAIDAGAEAKEVAKYISIAGLPGLCYLEPQKIDPMEIGLPGGNPGGGYLSPSSPSSP